MLHAWLKSLSMEEHGGFIQPLILSEFCCRCTMVVWVDQSFHNTRWYHNCSSSSLNVQQRPKHNLWLVMFLLHWHHKKTQHGLIFNHAPLPTNYSLDTFDKWCTFGWVFSASVHYNDWIRSREPWRPIISLQYPIRHIFQTSREDLKEIRHRLNYDVQNGLKIWGHVIMLKRLLNLAGKNE